MADISQLSDADLMAALGQKPANSLASMSDADLMKALQPQQQSSVGGIGSEIYNAGKSALSSITEAFNPNSATNAARMEQYKASGPFDLSPGISGLGTVAKGVMGVPELLSAPVTGTGRAVIGNTFDALSPKFSEADRQKLAQFGVQPSTGRDVADLAMMGARPAGASPVGLTTKPAPVPSSGELVQAYKDVRSSPSVTNTPVPAQEVTNFHAANTNALMKAGYRPTTASAPGTFSELQNMVPPSGGPVQLDDLLAARQAFSRYAGQTVEGKPTPDASAATKVLRNLDSLIEQYAPQMKDANANYSAAQRSMSFDLRGQKAQNNAAAANSGMNLENQLRSQVRQILNNPKLQRGLDAGTLASLQEFNRGSRTANVVRAVGNLLGGGGGVVGTGMSAGAGLMLGGPVGAAAAPLAGVAMKTLGNRMALNQFDALSQMMRANSPLARQAAPIPIGAPNPLLGSLPIGQLPQILNLRSMLGVMPSPADQQQ